MAQEPYKASVGGLLAPFAVGVSSKFFFCEHLAFQADILQKTGFTFGKNIGYNDYGLRLYWDLETNLNFVFQKKLKEKKISELFWFIGGGTSFGYTIKDIDGKFGVNAIVGLEYLFKNCPMAIQIDFRPGYGMLFSFDKTDKYVNQFWSRQLSPWSHFDWMIGFSIRYTFKKK